MYIDDIRTTPDAEGATRRNRENYDTDVAIDNQTLTGVNEYSHFNRIPFFHVTESSGVDLAHDITEGILHPCLVLPILHFIDNKYFTLEYLNDRMREMDYGEAEKGNLPVRIEKENLKNSKLKMTSSEMFFFAHHFTLMIGHLVPGTDPIWQFVLTTIKFFDLCYLPSYEDEDMENLKKESKNVNQGLLDFFGQNLQHKSHIHTHYRELTDDFGPLKDLKLLK